MTPEETKQRRIQLLRQRQAYDLDGKVRVSGTVRELVFNDTVARDYLGPTLAARLRARFLAEHGASG